MKNDKLVGFFDLSLVFYFFKKKSNFFFKIKSNQSFFGALTKLIQTNFKSFHKNQLVFIDSSIHTRMTTGWHGMGMTG
jgi:hypothetical protein